MTQILLQQWLRSPERPSLLGSRSVLLVGLAISVRVVRLYHFAHHIDLRSSGPDYAEQASVRFRQSDCCVPAPCVRPAAASPLRVDTYVPDAAARSRSLALSALPAPHRLTISVLAMTSVLRIASDLLRSFANGRI